MKNVDAAITISLFYEDKQAAVAPEPKPITKNTPIVRNIHFLNIVCYGAKKKAGEIVGLPESPFTDVTLENVRITGAPSGIAQQDAKGVRLINVDAAPSPAAPTTGAKTAP